MQEQETEQEQRRIRQVMRTIRLLMAPSFSRDSCIAGTRICIDVLASQGVVAEPLAVRVAIFNAAMVEEMERLERLPNSKDETLEWQRRCGAWSVAIGSGVSQPGRWPGHLVAFVPEHRLLIDISLDQATRREHNIVLNPSVVGVPASSHFLAGAPLLVSLNGCLLQYERITDQGYVASPNWACDPPVIAVTQQAIALLQAQR